MALFFGIAVFTLVEDAALIIWLLLVRAGQRVGGVATLVVGFFVEHVIAQKVKGGPVTGRIAGRIGVNAVVETVVWVVWLLLWPISRIAATAWLYATLVVEHSLTDNIFHVRPLFSQLLNRHVLGFTALETIGSTAWLAFADAGRAAIGIAFLVVFQYAEHARAIALGRRPVNSLRD